MGLRRGAAVSVVLADQPCAAPVLEAVAAALELDAAVEEAELSRLESKAIAGRGENVVRVRMIGVEEEDGLPPITVVYHLDAHVARVCDWFHAGRSIRCERVVAALQLPFHTS